MKLVINNNQYPLINYELINTSINNSPNQRVAIVSGVDVLELLKAVPTPYHDGCFEEVLKHLVPQTRDEHNLMTVEM